MPIFLKLLLLQLVERIEGINAAYGRFDSMIGRRAEYHRRIRLHKLGDNLPARAARSYRIIGIGGCDCNSGKISFPHCNGAENSGTFGAVGQSVRAVFNIYASNNGSIIEQ